jgi:hypothetical protein
MDANPEKAAEGDIDIKDAAVPMNSRLIVPSTA